MDIALVMMGNKNGLSVVAITRQTRRIWFDGALVGAESGVDNWRQ